MNSSATVKFVKVKVFKERFVQSFFILKRGSMCISLLQTSLLTNQNPAFIVGIRYYGRKYSSAFTCLAKSV